MTTVLEPGPSPAAPAEPLPAPPAAAPGRPRWSVPARLGVATLAAVLYLWDLSRVGYGNTFYAAAVKSGTESWKAFLFGSLDPGSFITVDKPPASLWVMELSGRIFGFSTLSMLIPEALAGVASVLVVYRLVRLWVGEKAAVAASTAFALTPVAVLMFRYNNPDAFLTLLLLLAAWALWSALRSGATWRLVACGSLVGLAFTTKMLQAFLVVPAFGLVYLWCGPPKLGRRVVQLLWAGLALVVSSAWWVALVELWPAGSRPYVGGSTGNSELNLIFGYNGFARVLGNSGGPGPGGGAGGGGPSFAGSAGVLRLFNDILAGQVSWLLPMALVGLVAGLVWAGRAPRTDLRRAGFVLWGGWALVTGGLFSEMQGIFHPYYTVALAPALAALAAGGAVAMWHLGRGSRWWCWLLPATLVGSAVWAAMLLNRTPGYHDGLGAAIVVAAVLSAAVLAAVMWSGRGRRGPALVAGAVAALALLAGPAAYAATTIGAAPSGGNPTAGPATTTGFGGLGLPGGGAFPRGAAAAFAGGGFGGGNPAQLTAVDRYLLAHRDGARYLVAVSGSQSADDIILATGAPVMAMGGFNGSDPWPTLAAFKHLVATGQVHYVEVGGGFGGGFPGGRFGGGGFGGGEFPGGGFPGGGGPAGFPPPGAANAPAGGGFPGNGGGFPGGGRFGAGGRFGGPGGGQRTTQAVTAWVEAHGSKVTVDGTTLYDVPSSAAR